MSSDRLEVLRKKIDEIDDKILELIEKRADLARKIYEIKKREGLEIFDSLREDEKLKYIQEKVSSFPKDSAKNIFVEIFSGTRKIWKELKIGYLGPEGSFSWEAAQKVFGNSSAYISYQTLKDVFLYSELGECDYGVVPLENSRDGIVGETLDLLIDHNVKIVHQISIPVSFSFLSSIQDKNKIRRIYSHPKAIAQCSRWIRENLPGVEIIYTNSTADGAKMAKEDNEGGAIGPSRLSHIFGLNILAEHIEDSYGEKTEFIVIKKKDKDDDFFKRRISHRVQMRLSFCFSVKDEPGALFRVLEPLAKRKINMKKIHSRPDRNTRRYNFFIEIETNEKVRREIDEVFADITRNVIFIKVFGEYSLRDF
ncbi:P-protein [bacterium HR19]|nr:P-protein [bacterium HR19]